MSGKILQIDRPCLFFGGPYSNLEATLTLLEEARRLNIPPERIICTGDVVAYCSNPKATAELVRSAGIHVVLGNCEESLAAVAGDCGCGFAPGSACERLSAAWFALADREIDSGLRAWMAGLPRRIDIEIGGRRLAVIHGGVETINRFIYASTAAPIKKTELNLARVDGVVGGHCGIPFTQRIGEKLWHNPGAIGMPANDGTSRVWFSIISPRNDGLEIQHRALEYDHATTAEKMRMAGLPEDYASALSTGLWPSCDSLPFKEIHEKGVSLTPGSAIWSHAETLSGKSRRSRDLESHDLWPAEVRSSLKPLDPMKFCDPHVTASGALRASVQLNSLKTLWFNTGTLCNIACKNCYIESSPKNDRLAYLSRAEAIEYLDEIEQNSLATAEIGFTGGEPFMNPEIIGMIEDVLSRGFRALVLTNAMRPMQRLKAKLLDIKHRFGKKLTIRVSLDHFTAERHEDERGPGSFWPTLNGLTWLCENGFNIAVSGRTMWGENEMEERAGYARLFIEHKIEIDLDDPLQFILFPEMNHALDVTEITEACWNILGKSPNDIMCSSSRMVVKRKDAERPVVLACTLIPYDKRFEFGATLREAARPIALNHPHCAQFCVLGGASCSGKPSGAALTEAQKIDYYALAEAW